MDNESEEMQYFFTADQEHNNDLYRSGRILIPIMAALAIVLLYAILFTSIYSPDWRPAASGNFAKFLWVALLIVTIITPLVLITLMIMAISRTIIDFIRWFYQPDKNVDIKQIIKTRLLGVPPLPPPLSMFWKYPTTVFKGQSIEGNHGVTWLGGPSTLTVHDGVALYLERGNRFSRVVGPGKPPMPFLERFEIVRDVIDLRPQIKEGIVRAWSKDGIQLRLHLRMDCQINANDDSPDPSLNLIYPFSACSVKMAAESTAVRADSGNKSLEEVRWIDRIWGQVIGYFRAYTLSHSLDELFLSGDEQLFSPQVFKQTVIQINQNINRLNFGAHLNSIQISSVDIHQDIDEQRLRTLDNEKKRVEKIRSSEAEARRIRVYEEARAVTLHDMLQTITERLRQVGPDNMTEPILLSLTGILDQNLDDPLVRPLIAKESISMLEKIRAILKEGF